MHNRICAIVETVSQVCPRVFPSLLRLNSGHRPQYPTRRTRGATRPGNPAARRARQGEGTEDTALPVETQTRADTFFTHPQSVPHPLPPLLPSAPFQPVGSCPPHGSPLTHAHLEVETLPIPAAGGPRPEAHGVAPLSDPHAPSPRRLAPPAARAILARGPVRGMRSRGCGLLASRAQIVQKSTPPQAHRPTDRLTGAIRQTARSRCACRASCR